MGQRKSGNAQDANQIPPRAAWKENREIDQVSGLEKDGAWGWGGQVRKRQREQEWMRVQNCLE